MTPRVLFAITTPGPLHRALFVSVDSRPVHVNSPAILEPEWEDGDETPWDAFAVNNNNREEVAVYLGLIWALLNKHRIFAVPTGYSLEAERELRARGGIIRWQYDVDSEGPPGTIKERGFRSSGTSVPIKPPPNAYEKHIRDKGELFELTSFRDLVAVTRAVLCDAYAEVNLFAITGEPRRLHSMLSGGVEPKLEALLEPGDLFVDLLIGVDLGYNDAVLVYSTQPLEPRLRTVVEPREAAIITYERQAPFLDDLPALLEALAQLAGVQ